MSFFHWSTLIALIAIAAAVITGNGESRGVQIAAIVITYFIIYGLGMALIGLQYFLPTVCRGPRGHNQIALTFDDGPDASATPALLDYLKQEQIPAAFFCIGRQVEAHPEIARRIVDDGHLIGNHSFHHHWTLPFFRHPGLIKEYRRAADAIVAATGQAPAFLRPPIGLTNKHYPRAAKVLGVTVVGWDVRPLDTVKSANKVIRHVMSRAQDGSIILLHDGGSPPGKIVEIVSALVTQLREKGYQFERVDRMI